MSVDWLCVNCDEVYCNPRNKIPTVPCAWCGELYGWVLSPDYR